MDIGPVLLSLALILLVAAFVARPLLERPTRRDGPVESSDLVTQREAILIELRELDFDHSTGKLAADDYETQRARLVAKGAEILKALDQLPAPDLDAEIERLIAARRQKKDSAGRLAGKPKAPTHCPKCRASVRADDKFCPNCGAKLA